MGPIKTGMFIMPFHDDGKPPSQTYEEDIELVSQRFREEYERSLIPGKFTLDTTNATVEETMAEFVARIQPYLTPQDRMGLLARSANLGV